MSTSQQLIPRQTVGPDPGDSRVEGLGACVEDPLWFLSRQWQLGEMEAENGGGLVRLGVRVEDRPLREIRFGDGDFAPIAVPDLPLEATVQSGNRATGLPHSEIAAALSRESPGWEPEHQHYRFSVRGRDRLSKSTLDAEGYEGGALEWYHFSAAELSGGGAVPMIATLPTVPTPVRFPGMPKARWWELDDSVDLGAVARPELDILTLLFLEVGLVLANDWYVVPVRQQVNSLREVTLATLIDTFGNTETLAPHERGPEPAFAAFSLGDLSSKHHLLLDTEEGSLPGSPLEEVVFVRDEQANLVWAVETLPRDPAAPPSLAAPPASPRMPRYTLMSPVPQRWIPYVPVALSTGRIVLQRGSVSPGASPVPPRTGIVAGTPMLREDTVPPIPVALRRHVEVARLRPRAQSAASGPYFAWLGRSRAPVVPRERLDLKFDLVH